ncbi:protein FAM216A [Protopterus annectens]|uniref:protein FAM216A n=1 Tax=Protopterus annectens TaxID=7888 RepID=UPI001CF9DC28|nr:protein FAM216A [Protopterus annectens]
MMRKQVTFIEDGSGEKQTPGGQTTHCKVNRSLATRALSWTYPQNIAGKNKTSEMKEEKPKQCRKETVAIPQLKTIPIYKSVMTAPFLKYPDLTAGQKRYLCSIANVYSTDQMRRLLQRQYIDILHQHTRSGRSHSCNQDWHPTEQSYSQGFHRQMSSEKRALRNVKSTPLSKAKSSVPRSGELTLPQIRNSAQRVSPEAAPRASNKRKPAKVSQKLHAQGMSESILKEKDDGEKLAEFTNFMSIHDDENCCITKNA